MLNGVYQQYKADTNTVAAWLAVTAKSHGYAEDALALENRPTGAGRAKGKLRTKAKAAPVPQHQGSSNTATAKQYEIKIKDFVPMASHIAKDDFISVPEDFTIALERVIWGPTARKTFAERLPATKISGDSDSEKRHSFFVGILEQVRDCLKPLQTAAVLDPVKPLHEATKNAEDAFKNKFDALRLYTPSESFLNAPNILVPKSEVIYVAEEDESFQVAMFALAALLDDYACLRTELKSLWADYSSGHLDLAAVSVATNSAFELARSMEDEVKPILDKHQGGYALVWVYFTLLCKACDIDAMHLQEPDDVFNIQGYHLAQECLLNILVILHGYAEGEFAFVKCYIGNYGWYDESLGNLADTNRGKQVQDLSLCMETLVDLEFLSLLSLNLGRDDVEDELIRGIFALMKDPEGGPPLWLAFSVQIYIVVVQQLGADCSRGFDELQQQSLRLKKSMLNVPASTPERKDVLGVAMKWDKDPIFECRNKLFSLDLLTGQRSPKHKFLRRNPIYCGLLIHHMRATFHTSGVDYATQTGALLVTSHLYQALRQEKLLADHLVWEDLETVWKMHGITTFFVGGPPTNREDYFRNYSLSIGLSASNWASNKRKGKPKMNYANRRQMKLTSRVSLMIALRLTPDGKRVPLSSDAIRKFLVDGRHHGMMDGRGHMRTDIENVAIAETPDPMSLSPTGLIRKLASDVHAEIPSITFDYFTLHDMAWALLKELRHEFMIYPGMRAEILATLPQEFPLPLLAGYVFSSAAGRTGFRKDEKTAPMQTLLYATADVMQSFLEKRRGNIIRDSAETKVAPGDVDGLDFEDYDPWAKCVLVAEIRKMGRGVGRPKCPVHAEVIGLTCALELTKCGHHVTVLARELPGDTGIDFASPKAGAHFKPTPVTNEQEAFENKLMRESFEVFQKIARNESAAAVNFVPAVEYFHRELHEEDLEMFKTWLDFRILSATELPADDGIASGLTYSAWVLNSPVYLAWLKTKAEQGGAVFIRETLTAIPEAYFLAGQCRNDIPTPSVVVDASGRGFGDPKSFPSRGQFLLLSNEYNRTVSHHAADGNSTVVIPRPLGGGTVVGGTKEPNNWSSAISAAATEEILARVSRLCPDLLQSDPGLPPGLRVKEAYIGRRPMRKGGLRLEAEDLEIAQTEANGYDNTTVELKVVHCYGAGPSGYKISWGAAKRVCQLIAEEKIVSL
ncbi:hypothetical protein G7046_g4248 [Stylonectria norvegica]|nr:hypothetical protein G7046_g4248 [Stylonectria norvegica]